jgi:hypothetical protein
MKLGRESVEVLLEDCPLGGLLSPRERQGLQVKDVGRGVHCAVVHAMRRPCAPVPQGSRHTCTHRTTS